VLGCRTVTRLLVDFIGEGLPAEYRELIEDHLKNCPLCLAFANSYQGVIRLTRQLPATPLPPDLLESLRLAVNRRGASIPADKREGAD